VSSEWHAGILLSKREGSRGGGEVEKRRTVSHSRPLALGQSRPNDGDARILDGHGMSERPGTLEVEECGGGK
jgi:hypothetical protein